jgi:hypothetical protein
MMRCLLGDVVASSIVWIVPVACKGFTQDRVQWFLNPSGVRSAWQRPKQVYDLRRFDMPAAQIEFDN